MEMLEQLMSPVSTQVVSCQPVYSKKGGFMGSGFAAISQLWNMQACVGHGQVVGFREDSLGKK